MRTVSLEEWKKKRQARFSTAVEVENHFSGRAAGMRPRDADKEEALIALETARRQRYIESGKLQVLGPRKLRWRIDFKTKR